MQILIISILIAIIIFCLCMAFYNIYDRDSISVNKRLSSYATVKKSRKLNFTKSIWQNLNESKFKVLTSALAERFGKLLPKQEYFHNLAEQAGLPISGAELMVLIVATTLGWFLLISALAFSITKGFLLAMLWLLMVWSYVKLSANDRQKSFNNQLGDAIVMMNNGLRAGFTFQQTMDNVSKELPNPIAGEFARALRETQLGVPLEEALDGVSKRMRSDDFDLLATAVVIQRQVGGNLSQILETIGTTIRNRLKLKREIKVLTAEGVFAGWTVALMPFMIAGLVTAMNPHYFDKFLAFELSKPIIAGCILSEIIGGVIIYKIIDLKV